jgi:hypothetical protein
MARPSDEPQPTPMPTSGLVFYWDMLDKEALGANTGQPFTIEGTIMNYLSNETVGGISGIRCSTTSYSKGRFAMSSDAMPSGNTSRTISVWTNVDIDANNFLILKYGQINPSGGKWWRQQIPGVDLAYRAIGNDIRCKPRRA